MVVLLISNGINLFFYLRIIFKSFDKDRKVIFSKGHRNPQGLIVLEEVILETEHGPKGGDEINKIIYKGNYGWPISSYGEKYNSNKSVIHLEKKGSLKILNIDKTKKERRRIKLLRQ